MDRRNRASFEGLTIHTAVFVGFGLVFGLWMFSWLQLSLRIAGAQANAARITARYMSAQETLAEIRGQVLTGSVVLRDALLDADPGKVGEYRQQLEQIYTAIDTQMARYEPLSDLPAELEESKRLQDEVGAFRATMLEVLATDSASWRAEARKLLSLRVTPKRDIVIAVSEGVQALNRTGYVQQQVQLAQVYRDVQRELWQLLGLALAISVAIAIFAVVYAGRLERRIRRQMTKDLELTGELQQLSDKLLTAQEQERRQIARELHDEIGQALTAIKVELAHAQHSIDQLPGMSNLLADARNITDGALHEVRDLSYLLHPAALDELGLAAAVRSHVASFAKRHNIDAQLTQHGLVQRLRPEIETAAYRIVQEALTNVARHANATTCRVGLEQSGASLRITVEDDGVGLGAGGEVGASKGLGLIGIRERAFHLGGSALFERGRGRGTKLVVELPARPQTVAEELDPIPDPSAA